MARIVVVGYAIRHPLGGNLFAFLHHVLGLHFLGHQVFYLEESGWAKSCYDPIKHEYGDDPTSGLSAVRNLIEGYGVKIPVCFVNRGPGNVEGTDWENLKRVLGEADLLMNVGGVCWLPEFHLCRRRALIDKDPFFTQIGHYGSAVVN